MIELQPVPIDGEIYGYEQIINAPKGLLIGDIVVVAQKAISKAEGMVVKLSSIVEPSLRAQLLAAEVGEDPRFIEVMLWDTETILRKGPTALLTRTHHGIVCLNAGLDRSNAGKDCVVRLPTNPDKSAAYLAQKWDIPVIISDTYSRYHRAGLINCAIGCYGLEPFMSYIAQTDKHGYQLASSIIAVADELASAAELCMGKLSDTPIVIIRGYQYTPGTTSANFIYDIRIGKVMRDAEKLNMKVTYATDK